MSYKKRESEREVIKRIAIIKIISARVGPNSQAILETFELWPLVFD